MFGSKVVPVLRVYSGCHRSRGGLAGSDFHTHSHSSSTSKSRGSSRSLSTLKPKKTILWVLPCDHCPRAPIALRWCRTHSLSSVSLLSEGSDRPRSARGTGSSRGTGGASVTSLSLRVNARLDWLRWQLVCFTSRRFRFASLTLTPTAPSLPGGPSDPGAPWDKGLWIFN